MIFPSNRVRILVATRPVNFRKGHDGLAALVKNELRKGPFTGTVFVFRAKRADRLKPLYRDGLMTLSHDRFEAPFAALDWRRVRAIEARAPETVE